jgi:anti-sigma regulatory factor (Ser/Thr protein kinase)
MMGDQRHAFTFSLPVDPAAPALARQTVRTFDQLADGMRPDLELLLTELVANVVRHSGLGSGDHMEVGIRIEPGRVRAEVKDGELGFVPVASPVQPPPAGAEKGYGLFLVDRIAARWGILDGPRPTVWFELEQDEAA